MGGREEGREGGREREREQYTQSWPIIVKKGLLTPLSGINLGVLSGAPKSSSVTVSCHLTDSDEDGGGNPTIRTFSPPAGFSRNNSV